MAWTVEEPGAATWNEISAIDFAFDPLIFDPAIFDTTGNTGPVWVEQEL